MNNDNNELAMKQLEALKMCYHLMFYSTCPKSTSLEQLLILSQWIYSIEESGLDISSYANSKRYTINTKERIMLVWSIELYCEKFPDDILLNSTHCENLSYKNPSITDLTQKHQEYWSYDDILIEHRNQV
jgi:hypothetical protein